MKLNIKIPTSVLIRVDGSSKLGIGHIMRCIALAQALEVKEIGSIFVIRNNEVRIKRLIRDYGYQVEMIPLEATFAKDADLTIKIAQKHKVDLFFTDLSNAKVLADLRNYVQYIKTLKKEGKFLVSLDGFKSECIANKVKLPFDLIIIPYLGAEDQKYKIFKKTRLLKGPKYFVLRQEFVKAVKRKRQINKKAKNVLISLSLVSYPLNAKIKQALSQPDLSSINYKFAVNLKDKKLVSLIEWADLAILSSGLSRYEAAALGLPCLIIAHNNSHDIMMKQYLKSNTCLYLGEENKFSQDYLTEKLKKTLTDYGLRKKMSLNGKKLIDGKGGERITKQIIQLIT